MVSIVDTFSSFVTGARPKPGTARSGQVGASYGGAKLIDYNSTVQNLINKANANPKSSAISAANKKFGFFIPPSPGQGLYGTPVINPTPEIIATSGADLIRLRDQILASNTVGSSGGLAIIPSSTGEQAGIFFAPNTSYPSTPQSYPSTPQQTPQPNPSGTGKPFFESLKEGFNQIPKEVLLGVGVLGIFLLLRK